MDDKRLLIKSLNVPTVSEVFMVAISLYRPCAYLPGNFQSDLFYGSQLELLNMSTLHPAAFFILYQNKGHTAAAICTTGSSSTYHGGQLATWSTRCVVNSP
ncbi:hypothetical protein T09_13905 [Trichinella sp. T9]|nr:hypothetical protein T09_13905 [Trichinella sp. T9]